MTILLTAACAQFFLQEVTDFDVLVQHARKNSCCLSTSGKSSCAGPRAGIRSGEFSVPCLLLVPDGKIDMAGGLCDLEPRPLARGMKRLSSHPARREMIFTFKFIDVRPSLCSAFAIADSSTLRMILAPLLGLKASKLSALSTGIPRIWSATSLPFWADSRTPTQYSRGSHSHVLLVALILRPKLVPRRLSCPGMALEGTVSANSPSLCPTMFSLM